MDQLICRSRLVRTDPRPMNAQTMQAVISTTALCDIIVTLVSVPLLVIFGLLLESNMRGDWTQEEDTRWNVLGLGLALLFVSLLVCCYVIHRLGICIWRAQNRGSVPRTQQNRSVLTCSTDSQLHLVVDGELPPSYASIIAVDTPPPYCQVVMSNKTEQATTVSASVEKMASR